MIHILGLSILWASSLAASSLAPAIAYAGWHAPGRTVTVAVIDSGIECSTVACTQGADFVDGALPAYNACYTHGTTIARLSNELVSDIEYMPLRVLGCSGTGTEQRVVDALEHAAQNGADIVHLGIFVSSYWNEPGYDQPGGMPALCQAIADFPGLVVAGTGNEGRNYDVEFRYPTSCDADNMLVVAGTDEDDELWTGFGSTVVDIAAPATDIELDGQILVPDGGSWAIPQVVAVAALELKTNPNLDALQLKGETLEHADVVGIDVSTGGRLNAFYPAVATPPSPPPPGNVVFSLAGGDYSFDYDVVSPWFTGPFRISATINLDPSNDRQPILTKQGGGERGMTFEVVTGNELRAEIWPEDATSPVIVSGPVLQDGVDYDVVMEHDGTRCRLLVDGVVVADVAVGFPRDNNQPAEVGRYNWSEQYQKYFNGRILDVLGENLSSGVPVSIAGRGWLIGLLMLAGAVSTGRSGRGA